MKQWGGSLYVTLDEALKLENRPAGEQRSHDILPLLRFRVCQEAERRAVLPKAPIEPGLLVPPIAAVVNIMICCGVGKVELITSPEQERRFVDG